MATESKGRPGFRLHHDEEPQRFRLLPQPILTLLLIGFWLLLVNSIHPRMIVLGTVFAVVVPWFSNLFMPVKPKVHRWGIAIRFVLVFLWDLVVANVVVALLILRVTHTPRSCWLVIPLDIRDAFGMATLASVISLTPGTVSSRIDGRRRVLLVHALDSTDPEREIALIKSRYERPLMEIFEP
jgi:multicomponent K+:H+ antiporter subunit E